MIGKIEKDGSAMLSWSLQEEKLYSPDGEKHCLPCENCGQPQWVSLLTVSTICDRCSLAFEETEIVSNGIDRVALSESGDFTCICGNNSHAQGAFACDRYGNEVDPTIAARASQDNLWRCDRCNRIFDGDTGQVKGFAIVNKFRESSTREGA